MARLISDWLLSPPPIPLPPAIRRHFMSRTDCDRILGRKPTEMNARGDLQTHTSGSDGTAPPANLTFCPVDFESVTLKTGLAAASLDFADQVDRQREVQMAAAEVAFRRESVDSRWAETAVGELMAALDSEESAGLKVRDLEYRGRAAVWTSRPARARSGDQGLALVLHRLAGTLPNGIASHAEDPDGTQHTILYLSRNAQSASTQH